MIGLNYIRKYVFDLSANWLANVMGITRQSVMDWEARRNKLLDYRLNELEKIFGANKKWYDKELDEIDKLKINNEILNSILTQKIFEITAFSKNIHYENTVIELEKLTKINDVEERNKQVLKQITENEKLINLLEIIQKIEVVASELKDDNTLYNLYLNCFTTFTNTLSNITHEKRENQDIEIVKFKKYLQTYNNDI